MQPVITVSRQLGSLGSYIAAAVAQELHLRYLDREILRRAADIAGYPDEAMIAHFEKKEQIPGLLGRILDILATIPPVPSVPSATLRETYNYDDRIAALMLSEHLTRDEAFERLQTELRRAEIATGYAEFVERVILEHAQAGQAMIVGRGGHIILREIPGVLHVQVIASEEVRSARLVQRMGLTPKEALQRVRQDDLGRARYMQHFHNVDWRDPVLYDLVINTDKVSVELATRLICQASQTLAQESAGDP